MSISIPKIQGNYCSPVMLEFHPPTIINQVSHDSWACVLQSPPTCCVKQGASYLLDRLCQTFQVPESKFESWTSWSALSTRSRVSTSTWLMCWAYGQREKDGKRGVEIKMSWLKCTGKRSDPFLQGPTHEAFIRNSKIVSQRLTRASNLLDEVLNKRLLL